MARVIKIMSFSRVYHRSDSVMVNMLGPEPRECGFESRSDQQFFVVISQPMTMSNAIHLKSIAM